MCEVVFCLYVPCFFKSIIILVIWSHIVENCKKGHKWQTFEKGKTGIKGQ